MRISSLTSSMLISNLYLGRATNEYNKSSERIATGKKLTTDIAGQLGTLTSLKSHKAQAEAEIENLNTAKDVANIKASALQDITDLAQKIYEEQQSANPSSDAITEYTSEINNILTNTKYKDTVIFDENAISFGTYSLKASEIAGTDKIKFGTTDETKASLALIAKEAGILGAQSKGIDARIKINTSTITNLEEAISRIEDVDISEENIKLAKYSTQQILSANMISAIQEQQNNLINILV